MKVVEPTRDQVLQFCAHDPVECVFLEDAARRGFGRFAAVADDAGTVTALCHSGANLVPSGEGCEAFASLAVRSRARMIIGEARAVEAVWQAARTGCRRRARTGQGSPSTRSTCLRRLASPGSGRRRWMTWRSSCPHALPPTSSSSESIR